MAAVASAAAVVAAGFALRAVVLASPLGQQNSDEAQTGLQSLELLRGHSWVFVPGNSYGGNAEAWLDAPLAWLFGASPLRTKVLMSLLWLAAAAAAACALRCRGWRAAVVAGALIWVPSAALLLVSTLAYPGYGAGLLATCLAIALATPAVDGAVPSPVRAFGVGLTAAFAVWMHPLFLLAAGVFAAAVVLRHLRHGRVVAPFALGAAVAAALPVWHNVRNGWPSLSQPVAPTMSYTGRTRGWLEDLLPRVAGQKFLGSWVLGGTSQGIAVALLVGVLVACVLVLRRGRWAAKVAAGGLVAAPLALAFFANTEHTFDGRYGVMVLPLAAVVVGEALAIGRGRLLSGPRPLLLVVGWMALAAALPLATSLGLGPSAAPDPSVAMMRESDDIQPLVETLRQRGIEAVWADFWVAYRITYGSGEEVVASPPGFDKFPRYDAQVRAAEAGGRAGLVLFNEQVAALDAGTLVGGTLDGFRSYERRTVGPWTVFLPPAPHGSGATRSR